MSLLFLSLAGMCLCFPGWQDMPAPFQQMEAEDCLEHGHGFDVRLGAERGMWADSEWHETMPRTLNGQWQLAWDDRVNDELDHEDKTCTIKFTEVDGVVTGQFIGLVAGTERDAMITGRFEGDGATRVFVFQQREAGYVCSYQAIDRGGEISGVWHDTRNRSGDFRLLKLQ